MKQNIQSSVKNDQGEIGTLAYELWEKAGRPPGRDQEFWFKAESQLRGKVTAAVPTPAAKVAAAPAAKVNAPVSPPPQQPRQPIPVAPPASAQRNQRLTSQTVTMK